MQSASRSRGRRRRGGERRAPCVPLQALTALPLSEQNDPRTTPTRCDAMRRDADFGKCNCNLLKFVAVAAHRRDTNRRRRRRGPNKTRKTNAAPKKKTNQSHPGKKFRSRFLSRFCVAPQHSSAPAPYTFALLISLVTKNCSGGQKSTPPQFSRVTQAILRALFG